MGREASLATAPSTVKVATSSGTYWRFDVESLRRKLQVVKTAGFEKLANLGGGDEAQFESTFSSIAYTYVKDRAPRLMDFIVGFQLIERDEDDTKALGVFGFRVSKQWLYVPVFFLNGDLKGHELLYLKQEDMFVPLRENWVNSMLSHKPQTLGEADDQSQMRRLGGLSPDLRSMSLPPGSGLGKRGCDDWARQFLPVAAAGMLGRARFLYSEVAGRSKSVVDLTKLAADPFTAAFAGLNLDLSPLMERDFDALRRTFRMVEAWPGLKAGFDRFYGADCFSRWGRVHLARQAAERTKSAFALFPESKSAATLDLFADEHPCVAGRLRVYLRGDAFKAAAVDDLGDDDKTRLLREGVLVKDARDEDEVSVAYETELSQQLLNPGETGLYRILEKPASFKKMLLVQHPHSNQGRHNFVTVVDVTSPRRWQNSDKRRVWADLHETPVEDDFRAWFDKLESASPTTGGVYLAIGANGSGTTPFEVEEAHGDEDYHVVSFMTHAERRWDSPSRFSDSEWSGSYISPFRVKLTVNPAGRKGTKIRSTEDEVRIPTEFKFVKLQDPPERDECGCRLVSSMESESRDAPIELGQIEDVQTLFFDKTASLKLQDLGGDEFYVRTSRGGSRTTKTAAFTSLIREHGLSEVATRRLMGKAAQQGCVHCRVAYAPGFGEKQASPLWSALSGGPSAPAYEDEDPSAELIGQRRMVQTRYPDEQSQVVDDMHSGQNYDADVHDPWQNYEFEDFQRTMSQAQQAQQSGQREVFDTSIIGGLVKNVRQDSIIDRYLGSLMKALDRLGRLLFLYFWHQEEWEDRYGSQDLPEIEDALRNAFEGLGDVVLYLKEKTVQVGYGNELGEPDLDSTAGN